MCGCVFPNKEGSGEKRGESRGEPRRGRGGGEGSLRRGELSPFQGEKENESKWSPHSLLRTDEPGAGALPSGSGMTRWGTGKSLF